MKNLIKKILTEIEVPHHYQPTGNSCGPTCLKMVHDFFVGDRFKISDICRACGTDWVVGTPPERMVKGLKYMGIEYVEHIHEEDPYQSLKNSIDKGHPCVVRANVHGTPHWIIVVDYDHDTLMVNDPWLGRLIYEIDEFDQIWLSGRDKIREYFYYEITNANADVYPNEDTEDEDFPEDEREDYMEDEYYGSFDGSDWYNQKDELTDTTKGEWEVEEFGSFEDFKNSPYGQDRSNKWSTHPNYDSGEKYFNMYKDKFGPIKIKKKVDVDYDKTTDVFNTIYESTNSEPEMWSDEWIENILVSARQAVGNETLSMDDLADFDEDTGNQDWQTAEELLRAFIEWYDDNYGEGEYEDESEYGEQLELEFPEDGPSNSDEVEISHFESEDDIVAALRVGLKVFEGQMGPKELLTYLSKAADWEISVKATYQGKVVGFYLLSENQIYDYMLHYMQRDYNCYSLEQCNKKHPGTIKIDPLKFKDLSGVEGVALGVDPNHKGLGIGKKLIEYSQNLPYDYVWGQQYEHLGNIEHWIKRREVAAYFPGLYLTYQML